MGPNETRIEDKECRVKQKRKLSLLKLFKQSFPIDYFTNSNQSEKEKNSSKFQVSSSSKNYNYVQFIFHII